MRQLSLLRGGFIPLFKRELQLHEECTLSENTPLAVPLLSAQTRLNHQDGDSDDPLLICIHQAVWLQAFSGLYIQYLVILKKNFTDGYSFPRHVTLRPCISRSGFPDGICEFYRR